MMRSVRVGLAVVALVVVGLYGLAAIRLQFWHLDGVTVVVWNVPEFCNGIDLCPGRPLR